MMPQQVSYLLASLLSRRASGLAGTGLAMTLVWYLGPLVPGMGGPLPRAAAILVLALAWTGVGRPRAGGPGPRGRAPGPAPPPPARAGPGRGHRPGRPS